MALPKISYPIYEVYLKSLDRKIKFRPFLVKEEKLLLMAKEGKDIEEIVKAIKQIIRNCVLEEIDVDSLPTFDMEMFFIHLRIRSVGEAAEMIYSCSNTVTSEDGSSGQCNHKIEFNLDLNSVSYVVDPAHNQIINLSDKIGMKLNYPSLKFVDNGFFDGGDGYKYIANNIDYIFDEDQIYKREQYKEEELKDFFESLSFDQIKQIRVFFETTPKVAMNQDVTCPKCGHVHNISVEGLLNFFE